MMTSLSDNRLYLGLKYIGKGGGKGEDEGEGFKNHFLGVCTGRDLSIPLKN